jgi:hypothetical protein
LFITDTGNKLFSGVNDIGNKAIAGVADTSINPWHGFSVIAGVVEN